MKFQRGSVQIGLHEKDSPAGCEIEPEIVQKYASRPVAPDKTVDSRAWTEGEKVEKKDPLLVDFWDAAEKKFGFNYFERRIIEDLLRTDPKPCKIFPIFIKTEENPLKDDHHFYINIGFVIMDSAMSRILYFRIQNHLRRMGLARRSLRTLLRHPEVRKKDIDIDLMRPSADGPETTSEADHLYFKQLFYSVKSEIRN